MKTGEKRNIRVDVFNGEQYDGGDWPGNTPAELLRWFEGKISAIPTEFMDTARVKLDTASGYEGASYVSIEIYYHRPETDEEAAAREARERADAERLKQRDLSRLEELKRKYGG